MFFKNIQKNIQLINQEPDLEIRKQKAAALKKKYKIIGLIMMICGFAGLIACVVLFALGSFQSVKEMSSDVPLMVIIPFCLFIPCAIVGGLGSMMFTISRAIILNPTEPPRNPDDFINKNL